MQEIIQIGVMNAVKTMNKIEIPSIPNLNFINPLSSSALLQIEILKNFYQMSTIKI